MSTMFFERTRTRRMSAPPAVLPERQARTRLTTEEYRNWVYTPSVEHQELPGVKVVDTGINWSGRRSGTIVVQPASNGSAIPETVLVLDGVSR